jgi:DNA polymerase
MLEWQLEAGIDETIGEDPVNRYALEAAAPKTVKAKVSSPSPISEPLLVQQEDPVGVAERAAKAATDLEQLRAAIGAFEQCELKRGARNLVFADGDTSADVMIIGEAPGRDEDMQGKPRPEAG